MVRVHLRELAEEVISLLDERGNLGAEVLQLRDIRVFLEEFSPEFEMEVDGSFDRVLEDDEFILEVDDKVDVDGLVLLGLLVAVDHFLLDDVFVAEDGELFLHVGLALLGDHEFEECFELVFEFFVLDMGVHEMETRGFGEFFEALIDD